MDDAEFRDFTTHYHQRQRPDLASDALKWYALLAVGDRCVVRGSNGLLLPRLDQDHPSLIPAYTTIVGAWQSG